MGIITEYSKKVKIPISKVTITRRLEGQKPGIEAEGTEYFPEVINCDVSYGFDQGSSTCTLLIKTPKDLNGDDVRFEPMDRVKVEQGWNKTSTLTITFFGFVDSVGFVSPSRTQGLECRDVLKLCQDNYYIHTNRKVYYFGAVEDELDDDGNPMGGQSVEDRQAQNIITDFLTESGIPESRLYLDFEEYPASGAIIIGNNAVAVFVYESAMDAVNRICDLVGYRLWADPVGNVQCRKIRPIASETAALSYQSQVEEYDSDLDQFTITVTGNLLSIDARKDDEIRNWITVIGYEDLNATVAGESEYVPDPPKYRRTEIRSYLLDTQDRVTEVAARIYSDLNRLRYSARATIEGDPRLRIGQTIELFDGCATVSAMNYFLYDYSSRLSTGNWVSELNLVGGIGEGSAPIGNISPVALFSYQIEVETLADGTKLYDVFADGSNSYDPNGDSEDLEFLWVCSGFDNINSPTASYVVSDLSSIEIELQVTDKGTPALTDTMVQTVSLLGDYVQTKIIYVASGRDIYTTDDGGESWVQKRLY